LQVRSIQGLCERYSGASLSLLTIFGFRWRSKRTVRFLFRCNTLRQRSILFRRRTLIPDVNWGKDWVTCLYAKGFFSPSADRAQDANLCTSAGYI